MCTLKYDILRYLRAVPPLRCEKDLVRKQTEKPSHSSSVCSQCVLLSLADLLFVLPPTAVSGRVRGSVEDDRRATTTTTTPLDRRF